MSPLAGNVVPVVDFSEFINPPSPEIKQAVANRIVKAFCTVGFVYLVNHGIPLESIDECYDWSKKFFALPVEEKKFCLRVHPPTGPYHRGWSGVANSGPGPVVREAMELSRDDVPAFPNRWPSESSLPGFRAFCLQFFSTCHHTQLQILSAIALGLGLPEEYFSPYHSEAENQLRFLFYLPVSEEALRTREEERLDAHTDIRTLTMLFQDEVGGLEVEDPGNPGVFRASPPIRGAMIINIGDLLARWTNDVLHSPLHRVTAPPLSSSSEQDAGNRNRMTPPRYSIPYFATPNLDAVIDCVPGSWGEGKMKKYEPISVRDYINMTVSSKHRGYNYVK
ncbi:flavonol synthase/flavanone 3-hydroxylase [Dacryopinax primogenitus]|uniref:Flavonol synthase/flavanone 3-hydroxylase n=1 Tax=Dacryopinax primogenitus (strain DJM 731) TaxID=1858805 RepID=M5FWC6_DACPD|nr:flavonol synthase/flavanone 3-hydroxylase [Dacryopinax primogenitus]EJT99994.1 flavonol synthase/flavanone 3-hydroxylase [Dacryopinax primogenitus]